MTQQPIRIATRASRLALWQANHIAAELRKIASGGEVELVEVSTSGDQDRTQPLHEMGGVGVFTREVQRAVLDGRADLAVHSLKDLPTEIAEGLQLAAVPERESRYDALVLASGSEQQSLSELPEYARIGTGSLRRQAQLRAFRPDLVVENVRGNVETRVRKLDDGEFDAVVLAEAGLRRLGLADRISSRLEPPLLFPAVGQGALGIECRVDDAETLALLKELDDPETRACVTAERVLLAELRAGCHAPVGVIAETFGGQLRLEAVVLSVDGADRVTAKDTAADPVELGESVALSLLKAGAGALIHDSNA